MYLLKIVWNDGSTQDIETENKPHYWQTTQGIPLAFEYPDGLTINLSLVRKWRLTDPAGVPVLLYEGAPR